MLRNGLDAITLIAVIVILLSVSCLAIDCIEEDAVDLTGSDGIGFASQEEFSCDDGHFLSAIELDEYYSDSNGLNAIESMKWTCSDGKTSAWFGDHSEVVTSAKILFGIGLALISSSEALFFLDYYTSTSSSPTFNTANYPYMGNVYFSSYSTSTMYPLEVTTAYGYGDTTTYALPTVSSCLLGHLAIGVTMYNSSSFVYGLRLKCAELTCSCSAPGDTANYCADSITPSPVFPNARTTPSPVSIRPPASPAIVSTPSPILPATRSPVDPAPAPTPGIRGEVPTVSPVDSPTAGGDGGGGPSMTATPAGNNPTSTTGKTDGETSLETPAIIGIGISAAVVLGVIVGFVAFAIGKRRAPPPPPPQPSAPPAYHGNGRQHMPAGDAHPQAVNPDPALTQATVAAVDVPPPPYTYFIEDD